MTVEAQFSTFGNLEVYICREPPKCSFDNQDGLYPGYSISGPQWESLFSRELGCPRAGPYSEGENPDHYYERYRVSFQRHLSQYPMLGRIWSINEGAVYTAEEVPSLLRECRALLPRTQNALAAEALNNLVGGCVEAINHHYGLVLLPD